MNLQINFFKLKKNFIRTGLITATLEDTCVNKQNGYLINYY